MGVTSQTGTQTHTVEMSASVVVNASTSFIQVEDESRTELFPSNVLADLDLNASSATFNPALSVASPGEGLVVRSLCLEDYDRGYLSLLSQLTSVGDISREEGEARWHQLRDSNSTYYDMVVGAATLVRERKFIHSCGSVGRLEDVVVSDDYRGRQLGKLLVTTASLLAVKLGCYKVTLNCNDKMIKFYSSLGYKSEDGNSNYMCIRVQGKPREPQA